MNREEKAIQSLQQESQENEFIFNQTKRESMNASIFIADFKNKCIREKVMIDRPPVDINSNGDHTEYRDTVFKFQPTIKEQLDYWKKRCEAAEDLISVMNVPKNEPIKCNDAFLLFGERNQVWQKYKSKQP